MIAQSNLPQSSNVSAVAVPEATQTALPAHADIRVTVRTATRKDRGAIRKIECACFGRSRFLFGLWPRAGARNERSWIMLVNDRPAGYLIAYYKTLGAHNRLYIGGVGVTPAQRGKGFGTKLVLEALLVDPAVWLHVRRSNEAAIRMYERLGMRVINRIMHFYSNGEDALVMSRVSDLR